MILGYHNSMNHSKEKIMNHNIKQVPYPVNLWIKNVRWLTQEEAAVEGWDESRSNTAVLDLSDGSKIYASCDPEGNGAGWLIGILEDKTSVDVVPMESIK